MVQLVEGSNPIIGKSTVFKIFFTRFKTNIKLFGCCVLFKNQNIGSGSSVTRFGEISPLLQNIVSLF